MIRTNLYDASDSHKIVSHKGKYYVLEYERDLSVSPDRAQEAYFASKMNVKKRQLIAKTSELDGVIIQAQAMQMTIGQVDISTNVRGTGDLMKKLAGGAVTHETVIKPYYVGDGTVVLEPTFRHIILEDLSEWEGAMVIEDGMFLACDDSLDIRVTARTNLSSTLFGGEGLFNTTLLGEGIVALESPVPEDELIFVELTDDVLKIDGNMALAWSHDLEFTVERSTRTLTGSMISGEGFLNVFRGTGKILVAPVEKNRGISAPENRDNSKYKEK